MIYSPREDSYLLQKELKKYCKPDYITLDMGTGSGILAKEAAKFCSKVVGVDIQKKVVDELNRGKKDKTKDKVLSKIQYKVSDLFSNVCGKFDLIIFNPPYLPEDVRLRDITVDGGRKGYEIIERFLKDVGDYLKPDGKILLLFSSLTKKEKVEQIIERYCLTYKQIASQKLFFEELYVYLIEKSELLRALERKRIKNIELFAHGQRGLIFVGSLGSKKLAIKTKYPKSEAVGVIENEAKFLTLLNKHKIGPKLLFFTKEYFAYDFVPGDFIHLFLEQEKSKAKIKKVLKIVLKQCFVMDKLGINKEEMHNPYKHVIVGKKITLLDFERCSYSQKLHNVTQFMQYVLRNRHLLAEKGYKIDMDKMIRLGREYADEMTSSSLRKIICTL